MPEEPSVLDYFNAQKRYWKNRLLRRPAAETAPRLSLESDSEALTPPEAESGAPAAAFRLPLATLPWRPLAILGLALTGQIFFEPPHPDPIAAVAFYLLAFFLMLWTLWKNDWPLAALPPQQENADPGNLRRRVSLAGITLAAAAFLLLGGGTFNALNLSFWLAAIAAMTFGVWHGEFDLAGQAARLRRFLARPEWTLRLSRWTLLLLAVTALALFFRLYRLSGIPAEPISDHAEKLFDINDILNGKYSIFFPRNTGREFFQMYWTVFVLSVFKTGVSFFSLKLGTALIGLLTLPYVYLFGKEIGGRRVALLALIFTAFAYWPNVLARVGLRFPLYPFFTAPLLFHLLRGLRTQNRNDFILAGLFLGLGLNGYSPYRIVPFLTLLGFGLFIFHQRSLLLKKQAVILLALTGFFALLVFLPLLRYTLEEPQYVFFRTLTRIGQAERPFPGNPLEIFVQNNWRAAQMFNVNNNDVWLNSVMNRPALDVVAGALFVLGLWLVLARYLRQRDWRDLFLLLSLPVLMLPSTLSLAFPVENPSINRAGGAYIIVFVLIALALDGLFQRLSEGGWRSLAFGLTAFLLLWSGAQNYDLVFNQYDLQIRYSNWNYSDLARVVKSFTDAGNPLGNARLVAFPYWVDTRLVPVLLGHPELDLTVWPETIPATATLPGNKLFLVNENDQAALTILRQTYPGGQLSLFTQPLGSKNFWVFSVPAQDFAPANNSLQPIAP
ncbi:MAG: hypothetical protein OHK0031_13330 [Anaerolineales bacterium]